MPQGGASLPQGIVRGGIQEIEFGAHQIRFRIVLACQLPKDSGVVGFKKSNLVPPAPNLISDCFGVPVAKGQRRRGIQEIKFGALQHQI